MTRAHEAASYSSTTEEAKVGFSTVTSSKPKKCSSATSRDIWLRIVRKRPRRRRIVQPRWWSFREPCNPSMPCRLLPTQLRDSLGLRWATTICRRSILSEIARCSRTFARHHIRWLSRASEVSKCSIESGTSDPLVSLGIIPALSGTLFHPAARFEKEPSSDTILIMTSARSPWGDGHGSLVVVVTSSCILLGWRTWPRTKPSVSLRVRTCGRDGRDPEEALYSA